MATTINDLTINPDGINLDELLDEWKWALPEPMRPVLLTAMGDVFAQGGSRAVYFIDMVEGTIARVADDGGSFQQLLADAPFVTDHLFPARVAQLRAAGKTLQARQVYSHKQPLILGGEDELENVETTDASVHVSIQGQIHRQVKELPDGAPIADIKLK